MLAAEVVSNCVEMKQAVMLLNEDDRLQLNSSNNTFASCRPFVSNPAVNQLKILDNSYG